MPTALEKIVESFPHPKVTLIVGQPSYKTIAAIQIKLNTKSASIYFHRGNGLLGLLYLTVKPAVYNTQSTVTFTLPTNPGHKSDFEEFQTYQKTNCALKTILISAFEEAYIRDLRDDSRSYVHRR